MFFQLVFVFFWDFYGKLSLPSEESTRNILITDLSGTYMHMLHAHTHTYTYAPRVLFPQLCWATFPSTVWRDNIVIYKPFRNRTRFLPNWILSFYTLCQFLEINNRPFHIGLWSHQLSYGIFPDVSVLGCYYKKHRPSWPVARLRYLLFCKMTWSCAAQGLAEGGIHTLTSGWSLELYVFLRKISCPM